MDCQEKRRKRTRFIRPVNSSHHHNSFSRHFLLVRSFLLFFAFITFIFLLSYRLSITYSYFRPVLVISSSFSLLSSYSLHNYPKTNFSLPQFKIDDRIIFPDYILLLLSKTDVNNVLIQNSNDIQCIYTDNKSNKRYNSYDFVTEKKDALSIDDYDEFRFIIRCPIPLQNHSHVVDLQKRGGNGNGIVTDLVYTVNQTVRVWDYLVYEAALDGDTAVVFAKGLNLRPGRVSDPTRFSCHFDFALGKLEKNGRFMLRTKAITAAQEVVRCSLPRSIKQNIVKAKGIRVTIGVNHHRARDKRQKRVLLPSVVRVFDPKSDTKRLVSKNPKYELCVCTMLWNQASSLREWILYHAWLGVQRWYIYDNNSDDQIKEVIEELQLGNYNVTLHLWPWIKTQQAGFSHCALRAKYECNWVSFMDVDEFFYFPYPDPRHRRFTETDFFPGQNSLRSLIANFSRPKSSIGEIRTDCHSFGPSGLNSPPLHGVAVGYTCRLQIPERHKSIVRLDALAPTLLNVVHHFHIKKGFDYLNLPLGTAVINHYKYQVWDSFRTKFFRRVATYVVDWKEKQNEGSRDRAPGLGTEAIEPPNWWLQFCEVWDTGLRDFIWANFAHPSNGLLPWE